MSKKQDEKRSPHARLMMPGLKPWRIMGVDPGQHGGFGLVVGEELQYVARMPTRKERKSDGDYRTLDDEWAIVNLMQQWRPDVLYCEDVYSMKDQGVVSVFSFGMSKGVLRGAAAGLSIEIRFVSPQKWKGQLGVMPPRIPGTTDEEHKARLKALSISRAQTLFPSKATELDRDGPAEGSLIAAYGLIDCRRRAFEATAVAGR